MVGVVVVFGSLLLLLMLLLEEVVDDDCEAEEAIWVLIVLETRTILVDDAWDEEVFLPVDTAVLVDETTEAAPTSGVLLGQSRRVQGSWAQQPVKLFP